MMDTPNSAELIEEEKKLEEELWVVINEIRSVLETDLPAFVERELKKAFLNNTEHADHMSDDQIKQLKMDISEQGSQAATSVLEEIRDKALWFDAGSGKSIADNGALWAKVNRICDAVDSLKSDYGFPEEEKATVYKAPTWFIDRLYLPTLSERYWRLLEQRTALVTQKLSAQNHDSQNERAKRWNEF
jgi:hypothetical protein